MNQLNPKQLEAVLHKQGPLLVIAPPGSGKTYTICHRIKALRSAGVEAEKICVLTFTKAATLSMQTRYQNLMGYRDLVYFGTIHALCYAILSDSNVKKPIHILSELSKTQLVKRLYHELFPKEKITEDIILDLCKGFSYLSAKKETGEGEEGRLYQAFLKAKEKEKVMDLDDLLLKTLELLNQEEEVLKKWQQRFSYFLVDEFQDVNRLQLEILFLLSKKEKNIMAVGDDDQSIYGFRGSVPGIFKLFEEEYQDLKKVFLDLNYRSFDEIIECGQRCISRNKDRYEKTVFGILQKGGRILYKNYQKETEQIREMVQVINKKELGKVAVLFRTNGLKQRFLFLCKKEGLVIGGSKRLEYAKEVLEDLGAYCNLVLGENMETSLVRILNKPNRNLGRFYITEINKDLSNWINMCYSCGEREQAKTIFRLNKDLNNLRQWKPVLGIQYLFKGMGYDSYATSLGKTYGLLEQEQEGILKDIAGLVEDCESWEEAKSRLREENLSFRQEVADEKISCITMHGAKGLEYDTVFIPYLNDGIIPSRHGISMEEERRLFYVAITRAKKNLYLLSVKHDKDDKVMVSRFLKELK